MATTATWGEHTYMLRDAYSGKLKHIPPNIMSVDIASPKVWECTRLVIASDIATQAERAECMQLIVDGLVDTVRRHGAEEMICLSSLHLMRALRQLGYKVDRLGETYQNSEDGRTYGVLRMPAEYSNARKAAMHASVMAQRLADLRVYHDVDRIDPGVVVRLPELAAAG